MTFTDADFSDTHTVTVTGVTATGTTSGLPLNATVLGWLSLGTLTDSTNGATGSDAWNFSAQDKYFDYLAATQTVTLTFTVQVADTHGGSTTQNVVVTVTGTDDTPVITSSAQSGAITELTGQTGSTTADTANGAVTFTDADLSDTHTVTITGVTASGITFRAAPQCDRAGLALARYADRLHQWGDRLRHLELFGAGQELRLSGGDVTVTLPTRCRLPTPIAARPPRTWW